MARPITESALQNTNFSLSLIDSYLDVHHIKKIQTASYLWEYKSMEIGDTPDRSILTDRLSNWCGTAHRKYTDRNIFWLFKQLNSSKSII